jgi:hypothetical protein
MVDTSLAPAAPLAPSAVQDQAPSALTPAKRRILSCFQLGWKIEQLAGLCRLPDPQDMADQSGFPPDLPAAQLQQAQILIQEVNSLLSLLGVAPPPSGNGSQAPATPPDLRAAVQSWIAGGTSDPSPILTALLALDTMLVPYLVTEEPDSASETAYELGKALSLTYWDVAIASRQANPDGIARAWAILFAAERVSAMQRRLSLVGPIFSAPNSGGIDPTAEQIAQAMQVVSGSLEYWRNTLLHLDKITGIAGHHPPAAATATTAPPSAPIDPVIQRALAGQPEVLSPLLSSLQAQQTIWYDVLTGRQSVESLCPTGILLSLAEDLTGHTWGRIWHLLRRSLPLLVGLLVTIGVLGGMVALGIGVLHNVAGENTSGSAVASVLTVLGAGLTYAAAIGAALVRRGRIASRLLEVSTQEAAAAVQQTTQAVASVAGPAGGQAASLVHEGLDNVVEQITQEERTVMVTLPLVQFVLERANRQTGDPLQDATAFLRLVYQGRSNLERLLAIFPELYVAAAAVG